MVLFNGLVDLVLLFRHRGHRDDALVLAVLILILADVLAEAGRTPDSNPRSASSTTLPRLYVFII